MTVPYYQEPDRYSMKHAEWLVECPDTIDVD